MPTTRAMTVSSRHLSTAVAAAVDKVKAHNESLGKDFIINNNFIMGRWIIKDMALKDAVGLAEHIAHAVQAGEAMGAAKGPAGPGLRPAVMASGGHIICGFILDPQVALLE